MGLLDELLIRTGEGIGAAGQVKAAEFCYGVFRRAALRHNRRIAPVWIDLTQREQEAWTAAVWEQFSENKRH